MNSNLEALRLSMQIAWPEALKQWSPYIRLKPPILGILKEDLEAAQLTGAIAHIRLADQAIAVDLREVQKQGLEEFSLEILAHEIGHHVLAPATLSQHFRLLAIIRANFPNYEEHAPLAANLFTDLYINDRLRTQRGLAMEKLYPREPNVKVAPAYWQLYLRIYERLWQLLPGTLIPETNNPSLEGDAWLGAKVIRVFSDRWLEGAGSFAALFYPYFTREESDSRSGVWGDLRQAANGAKAPSWGTDVNTGDWIAPHPSEDPRITGKSHDSKASDMTASEIPSGIAEGGSTGQCLEPWQVGEILQASGIDIDNRNWVREYYRTLALRQGLEYPRKPFVQKGEPLPEGLATWEWGEGESQPDWVQSLLASPHPIPGYTLLQRVQSQDSGFDPGRTPLDLDLYIDCSGSMPDPAATLSPTVLAGAVLSLAALRAGAQVRATLWSGKGAWQRTRGFVSSEKDILDTLVGYIGGATCFPLPLLRDDWRKPHPRAACHLFFISDDGISTLYDKDDTGKSGQDLFHHALKMARGGATFALAGVEKQYTYPAHLPGLIQDLRTLPLCETHFIEGDAELMKLAKSFVRRFGNGAKGWK